MKFVLCAVDETWTKVRGSSWDDPVWNDMVHWVKAYDSEGLATVQASNDLVPDEWAYYLDWFFSDPKDAMMFKLIWGGK